MLYDFDQVIVADMSFEGDENFRIALEIGSAVDEKQRVGLLHVGSRNGTHRIASDVQGCVSRGIAHPIRPGERISVKTLVVHGPQRVCARPTLWLPAIDTGQIVLVVDEGDCAHFSIVSQAFRSSGTPLLWAPMTEIARSAWAGVEGARLHPQNWLPKVKAQRSPRPPAFPEEKRIVGSIGVEHGRYNSIMAGLETELVDAQLLALAGMGSSNSTRYTTLEGGSISVGRFLARIDALAVFEESGGSIPYASIAWMLAMGKQVLCSPGLSEIVGHGPVYCEPEQIPERTALTHNARNPPVPGGRRRSGRRAKASSGTAIFLGSSDGGLGYLDRLIAVGRRCRQLHPVFVSLSPEIDIIEAHGFEAHYIPAYRYLNAKRSDWDDWFQAELELLIDLTNAAVVVYDGVTLDDPLVRAVGSRGCCRLVWIRPAVADGTFTPFPSNDNYCDLILEPGELAEGDVDVLPEHRRSEALRVAPVRLLGRREMLSRREARAALSVKSSETAALIQLGADSSRDSVSLIDFLMGELRRYPNIRVFIADWVNASHMHHLWPDASILAGHPFGRLYNAFDFSISGASYSTFHDIIAAGLPTIFVPGTQSGADDQRGRARYSEGHSLALCADKDSFHELPRMIDVLMSRQARTYLRNNCLSLRTDNGADTAAAVLEGLPDILDVLKGGVVVGKNA